MRLGVKLMLALTVLSVLPLGGAVVAVLAISDDTLRAEASNRVEAFGSAQAARVEAVLQSLEVRFSLVRSQDQIQDALVHYEFNPSQSNHDGADAVLADAVRRSSDVKSVSLASTEGLILLGSHQALDGSDIPDSLLGAAFSDPLLDIVPAWTGNDSSIVFAAPYRDAPDVPFLVIEYEAAALDAVARDFSGQGETGETLIGKRDASGRVVIVSPLRHAPFERFFVVESGSEDRPMELALDGETGVHFGVPDYRDEPVIAATYGIEGSRLGLVAKVDQAEALAPGARLLGLVLAIFLVAGTLVLAGVVLLSRQVAEPVERLARTASAIAGGDFSQRTNVTTKDEIGQLGLDFNRMTESLIRTNRDLERRVAERTAELERSNHELEQFAYVASHDLQEPLRMVASYLQLIERRYRDKLDDEGIQFIEYAVDGAVRMKSLIQALLDYSHVGSADVSPEPVDLGSVLMEASQNLTVLLEEAGGEVVMPSEFPEVLGDRRQYVQLFQNLLSNAIKFRGKARPRIEVSVRPGETHHVVSVTDNGIGIKPEYQEKIFALFQRLHSRQQYEGTGIGLALCRKIVARHGGQIWVESTPGQGSTFSVALRRPEFPQDDSAPETPPPQPGEQFARRREELL